MIILITFSFLAGLITMLSPCILSIAPILLAANAEQSRSKPLGIIIGLVFSFSFFTLSLTTIVRATGITPDIFRYAALGMIIFFGLTMLIPAFENAFNILTAGIARVGNSIQRQSTLIQTDFISGLLLGIALGLLWTPCAGPILATITTIAATSGITATSILMAVFYSLGAAVPMALLSFGSTKIVHSLSSFSAHAHTIRKILGIITITSALAIMFHADVMIQEKIAQFFPNITLEQNSILQKELDMLHKKNSSEPTTGTVAPEITGIAEWLNSQPLTLAQLRGKVVLLDFWTYTCINCIRTLPHITQWYNTYKDKGLEIIGIHTPEFAFEKSKPHVEDAIKRFNITYPVALDNEYKTWQAYSNRYWPSHYLIDQHGIIVKRHFGEGGYVEMENAICALLNLPQCDKKEQYPSTKPITPETYLGFERADRYSPELQIQPNQPTSYNTTTSLRNDQVGLTGVWTVRPDCIQSESDNNKISLDFIGNHVYLVMQSDNPQLLTVLLDGKPVPEKYRSRDMNKNAKIMVHKPRMYELIDLKEDYGRHTLTLQCQKGINAYVFTFGGEK